MKNITLLILLLVIATANAELNAKSIDSVDVKIAYGGVLETAGGVQRANITYYIPQEGVTSMDVTADGDMTWKETMDALGNKLILMEWTRPTGRINYNIDITVKNKAKRIESDNAVGTDDKYLAQTKYVKIDDNIRQMAYPYEKSLKRAAELTKFVYDYVEYDLSYVGQNVPSDQVALQGKGVCVEHANLLAALLRSSGIPTRYVVGYAYSTVQEKFIGHTWIEVLDATGRWVPFDPTWLQAGHIDATHIRSAALLDNSQIDTLTYIGGNIKWTRNEEKFTLTGYTERNITSITTEASRPVYTDNFGYIKADIETDECTIVTVTASSCVTHTGYRPLEIYQANRTLWMCAPKEIYWFFKATEKDYVCPVVIFDQTGSFADQRVAVREGSLPTQLSISGPSIVNVNKQFTLTASKPGLFYSPEFGMNTGTQWTLSINKPGTYLFYLYSDGLHIKDVHVMDNRDFEMEVVSPDTAAFGHTFGINLTIKNLADEQNAEIKAVFTNQTAIVRQIFQKGEEKKIFFQFTANREGDNDLVVLAAGNSLASETLTINTPARQLSIVDSLAEFFENLISFLRLA